MKDEIKRLEKIFREMVKNAGEFGLMWKNIPLGREAFAIMQHLPDSVPGEFATAAEKAGLLGQMLEHMDELRSPRFCIAVREYMSRLDPAEETNATELAKLYDYIDPTLPMEDFCRVYRRHLKFDPVERTAEYEAVIYSAEYLVSRALADVPRGMGFCFAYWSAMADALAEFGIDWRSPHMMNPGVMFD